jgi:hypothetical protein
MQSGSSTSYTVRLHIRVVNVQRKEQLPEEASEVLSITFLFYLDFPKDSSPQDLDDFCIADRCSLLRHLFPHMLIYVKAIAATLLPSNAANLHPIHFHSPQEAKETYQKEGAISIRRKTNS